MSKLHKAIPMMGYCWSWEQGSIWIRTWWVDRTFTLSITGNLRLNSNRSCIGQRGVEHQDAKPSSRPLTDGRGKPSTPLDGCLRIKGLVTQQQSGLELVIHHLAQGCEANPIQQQPSQAAAGWDWLHTLSHGGVDSPIKHQWANALMLESRVRNRILGRI